MPSLSMWSVRLWPPARGLLDRGRRFLKELVRSSPAALALLVALCAAWAGVLASFLFLLAPRWARFGLPYEATPAGRAACFLLCVLSAWVTERCEPALWSVEFGQPAAEMRAAP